jgi:hypothetical protein
MDAELHKRLKAFGANYCLICICISSIESKVSIQLVFVKWMDEWNKNQKAN